MADGDAGVLPRFLDSVAKLRHRLNSAATDVGQRQRINWVDTATVTWTVTESSINEEILISATGAAQTTPIPGYYGDISDGTATMDGSTTVAGMVPSSSIYTAVRDLFFDSLTINNAIILNTGGFRVHVQGTLTNNGTIHRNGNAGANGTGTGGAGGLLLAAGSIGGAVAGGAGGNNNTAGSNGSPSNPGYGGSGTAGGISGTGRAGGNGGTATAPPAANGGVPRAMPFAALLYYTDISSVYQTPTGGAGGGGGGAGVSGTGGGGGGGGGIVFIAARLFAGTGSITVTGGIGGDGAGTGGAGGGGGGGGGAIFIVSSSVSAGAIAGQTITAAGGTGGAKIGTGVAGAQGSAGRVIYIQG